MFFFFYFVPNVLSEIVVATCHEAADTPESTPVNPSDGTNYWLIAVALLSIACLLLLVVIAFKYDTKCGLTILCLLPC